jgi:hypothetical protein
MSRNHVNCTQMSLKLIPLVGGVTNPGALILTRYGLAEPSLTTYTPISPFGASIAE